MATRSTKKALVRAAVLSPLLLAVVAGGLSTPANVLAARAAVPLTPTSVPAATISSDVTGPVPTTTRVAGPPVLCAAPKGPGPGYSASVTNKQDGETVCITVGEKLLVFLTAPSPGASPWRGVHTSKPGILRTVPLTLVLPRGATAVNFLAVRQGVVELTSQRPVCVPGPPNVAACDAIMLWRVTVVVRV